MSVNIDGRNYFTKEMASVFETEVIECPDCVFEYASKHEVDGTNGLYECPSCIADNLEITSERFKAALEEIAYHVSTPLGEKEDYKNTVYEFINIAKNALGY